MDDAPFKHKKMDEIEALPGQVKASDLFVRALEREGVKYIFGVPGEENLDLLESLRTSSIQLILTRHEQSAGFMAATYGRFTGVPGVCLATLGPGATNLVTASAYAKLGGMPMLLITGQKPIKKSKQGHFQMLDVVSIMRPVTKMAKQIVHGHAIPAMVREAFRLAEEERPGPVHLELPEDIARETTEKPFLFQITTARRSRPDEKAVVNAITLIKKAKRPLLLVGAGANRKRVCKALTEFVNKTKIPFFSTQMGKGVVSEDHPLCLGTAALSENDYIHCAIDRADLILNVGHDVIEKPPFLMSPQEKTVIHVNYFPSHVDEVYFPQLEVVGDIAETVEMLTNKLTEKADEKTDKKADEKPDKKPDKKLDEVSVLHDFDYFMRIKQQMDENISAQSKECAYPMLPQRLVKEVRAVLPKDGILALDNGMYKIWFARNFLVYFPNTLLLDNALATMGAGLPAGMMAAMLHPDKCVMVICGDGGFMMNSQELETAVRLKLNLVVLILEDGAYGMIKWKQAALKFPDFGLDFGNPDFVKYAESYGAKGYRLTKTEDFAQMVNACFAEKGVHVIAVSVDYSQNVKVLLEELQQKVCLL